jgi:hypothetical protein
MPNDYNPPGSGHAHREHRNTASRQSEAEHFRRMRRGAQARDQHRSAGDGPAGPRDVTEAGEMPRPGEDARSAAEEARYAVAAAAATARAMQSTLSR